MSNSNTVMTTAIAGLLAASLTLVAGNTFAAKEGMEKCKGIAKKAMNDCGTKKHACAGMASADAMANEWVYVPTGTCGKIVNGKVKG